MSPGTQDAPKLATAHEPPEARGVRRDHVRLLVSTSRQDHNRRFDELPDLLRPGDLLVVNASATIPASLPARSAFGTFRLNLATRYGNELWLTEPRWGPSRPGPVPLTESDVIEIGELEGRPVGPYPGIPRLLFVRFRGDPRRAMRRSGRPIRYAYVPRDYPVEAYSTVFGHVPGSVEMPSAARPFTTDLVRRLRGRGIRFAEIVLHAGVSSLEPGDAEGGSPPIFPEPFDVPEATVAAVARTHARGGRVVAVGTTVVRALETASAGGELRPARGFTRLYLSPNRPVRSVDALLTGFHEATSTHLALLKGFAPEPLVERSYARAAYGGYRSHEFGDVQLLVPGSRRADPSVAS